MGAMTIYLISHHEWMPWRIDDFNLLNINLDKKLFQAISEPIYVNII